MAPSSRPLSSEAERQRRCRERRQRGAMPVQLVLGPAAIHDLVRLGWLRHSDRTDRQAVRDAFIRFARASLRHG
jgi:hypothetical protein